MPSSHLEAGLRGSRAQWPWTEAFTERRPCPQSPSQRLASSLQPPGDLSRLSGHVGCGGGGSGCSSPRTLRLAEDEADPMSFTAMHV